MATKEIPEPWLSFLKEIDESMDTEISFHCFGGFAIKMLFELPRETADIDIVSAVVSDRYNELRTVAGKGSALHDKYKVYLDLVGTIAVLPDSYAERLIPVETRSLNRIKLYALEPHDIILAKLGRDAPKDVQDVVYLAKVAELDTERLRSRYETEYLPYIIGPPERTEGTLRYWVQMIDETRSKRVIVN